MIYQTFGGEDLYPRVEKNLRLVQNISYSQEK